MHLKNIPIFLLCVQMLLPGAVLAGSGSCIVSGSIARDAAASAVSHHAIRFDGEAWGSYAGMVQLKGKEGRSIWASPQKVSSIGWQTDGRLGVMTVSGSYSCNGNGFELVHRLTFAPGVDGFLAEIESIENTGTLPLSGLAVFARLIPPRGMDCGIDGGVPDLWKGPNRCAWVYPGIGRFSARTWDSSALRIRFWTGKDGHPHGDIVFRVPSGTVLRRGEKWRPGSPMGVWFSLSRKFS